MTHADALLIVALLFIIAFEVGEMNLRQQGIQWPWVGSLVGVLAALICFALIVKWVL
jgi:hypothetical protein